MGWLNILFYLFKELEQEKYHLRRRLQAAEEEYDLRVGDLQSDINGLRKTLEEASYSQRQSEKEKSLLITNLTEQNQRLTSQLKEVSHKICQRIKTQKFFTLEWKLSFFNKRRVTQITQNDKSFITLEFPPWLLITFLLAFDKQKP